MPQYRKTVILTDSERQSISDIVFHAHKDCKKCSQREIVLYLKGNSVYVKGMSNLFSYIEQLLLEAYDMQE